MIADENNFQAKIRKKNTEKNVAKTTKNLTCPEIKILGRHQLKRNNFIKETWLQPYPATAIINHTNIQIDKTKITLRLGRVPV
jgi:hypothetical protein